MPIYVQTLSSWHQFHSNNSISIFESMDGWFTFDKTIPTKICHFCKLTLFFSLLLTPTHYHTPSITLPPSLLLPLPLPITPSASICLFFFFPPLIYLSGSTTWSYYLTLLSCWKTMNYFHEQNAILVTKHGWWNGTDRKPHHILSACEPKVSKFRVYWSTALLHESPNVPNAQVYGSLHS